MARYRIVPERSRVWIDGKSSLHPIHSATDGLEGFVDLQLSADGSVDPDTVAGGRVSLPVGRLSTGNRMEDRELQKRIDARKFPTIEAVLDQLAPVGDDGTYRVAGHVTFRGVVKPRQGEMSIGPDGDGDLVLSGRARFDVREFGLEPPRVLVLRVEPEVDVRVEIVASKEG